MTEVTEEVIGAGYQTVDPEKKTISVGPVNPGEKKISLGQKVKELIPPSIRSGVGNTREFLVMMSGGHKAKDLITPEQRERAERQGKTVGDPAKAESFKKTQEANVTRSTTPPQTWQSNPR